MSSRFVAECRNSENVLRILIISCKGPGKTAMNKYVQDWNDMRDTVT